MLLLEGVLSQKKQLRYSPWPAVLQKSSLLELSTMSQWCQTKLQVLSSWTLITNTVIPGKISGHSRAATDKISESFRKFFPFKVMTLGICLKLPCFVLKC